MNDPREHESPKAPELKVDDRGTPTWVKVLLWLIGIFVGLPIVGLLLLFGYCAVAGR